MRANALYQKKILLDADIEDVFRFHLDPNNLALLTPPGMELVELSVEAPVRVGSEVRLTTRQFKFLVSQWVVRIHTLESPNLMVDEALKSPFRFWRHEHRFTREAGGTLMEDRIQYRLKWDPPGLFLSRYIVKPQLESMFRFRHLKTREYFQTRSRPDP